MSAASSAVRTGPVVHADLHANVQTMVAIQIRDVPESVRDELARAAKAEGKSLQAFLREVVEREAKMARNREFLRNLKPMPVEGPPITREEIVEIIRQGREERDRAILGDRYPEGLS